MFLFFCLIYKHSLCLSLAFLDLLYEFCYFTKPKRTELVNDFETLPAKI